MAKIRFTSPRSGPGGTVRAGDIADVGDREALRLVRAGKAELIAEPVAERATSKRASGRARRAAGGRAE